MSLDTCLLDQPIIRYRRRSDRAVVRAALPALLAALQADEVDDFIALRPHQRHPWHAFLAQLAAIALHRACRPLAQATADTWRADLLALTPDHPGLEPWCLVSAPGQPALLQAAEPSGDVSGWKNQLHSPDELDMLVTSKNHDLKGTRMRRVEPDDWLFALLSLQTQEGSMGSGNYGISRMNKGYGSRPAFGAVPPGGWGRRWARDVAALLQARAGLVDRFNLAEAGGLALVWLVPWDGVQSLNFESLDPFYIEICRRVRLEETDGHWVARVIGSKAGRISAENLNGCTGDAWTPLDKVEARALPIPTEGFGYKLATELAFGQKFEPAPASLLRSDDGQQGIILLAQGVKRGQGKTEGYHERRIPVSRRMVGMMRSGQTDQLAKLARERIEAIEAVRNVLWGALCTLLDNAKERKDKPQAGIADRANRFAKPFEADADARFFADLALEIEASIPDESQQVRAAWLLDLEARAEAILRTAFTAGPRSAQRRYQAQAAALGRFQGVLRGKKSPLPELARLHAERRASAKTQGDALPSLLPEESNHEHA